MVGVDEAFKSKMKMLEELFKSKLFNLITAANNALPKCGQDNGTSTAATLQVRFWGWTVFI
jgi:hypothetical protein